MREEARSRPALDDDSRVRRLATGFVVLAGLTVGLIVLGALVRAIGAGLACPDWPLCFGRVIPALDLKVAFEWSHRVLAGTVSVAFAILAFGVLRRGTTRSVAGSWVIAATGLLAIQIVLGALTVWQLLASWTVTSHLVTGNAFAVVLMLTGVRLRRLVAPASRPEGASPGTRAWLGLACVLLGAQVVLGGLVASTYAALACPEWPTCNGSTWYPSLRGSVGLHLLHRTNGYLLLGVLAGAAARVRRPRTLARVLRTALALGVAQATVGVLNVVFGVPVEVTGLHSGLSAALVLTLAFGVHEVWSWPEPARARAPSARVAEAR